MTRTGAAIYYDGVTSARHTVTVELERDALAVRGEQGHLLTMWPYHQLEHLYAPAGVLRLGRARSKMLARLEVRDPVLSAAIDERSTKVDRTGAREIRGRARVVWLSFAAVASLIAVAVFGLPALATRLAPIVPTEAEVRLGKIVESQIRDQLDTQRASRAGRPFECGDASGERAGRAALDKLVARLEKDAALGMSLSVQVVRRKESNAVALPGGRIYVFEGMIDRARTPDELGGIIAHEIGHVAHRDGLRAILQDAGLSFLFGMLLGDFVGGGAVVVAAKSVLQSAYSRDVETAADVYGATLMVKIGGDGRALASILERISDIEPGSRLLSDHPRTAERVVTINETVPQGATSTLLAPSEWAALKRICAG